MADLAVEARDVWFTYEPAGKRQRPEPSLRGVTLDVAPGEVYGILGPNGAGKTTLLKILSTLLLPAQGEVRILGHRVPEGDRDIRRRLGIAMGEHERTFHFRLTGRQNLRFYADFLDVPRTGLAERIDRALAEVGLGEAADKAFLAYSTGMKHRLAVARALLNTPELLILDEPTAGLDVETSRQLGELVLRLAREENATVLYTTHRLEEAGRLCDRIAIMRRGEIVAIERPDALRRLSGSTAVISMRLDRADEALMARLRDVKSVREVYSEGPAALRVHVEDVDAALPELLAAARHATARILSVQTEEPSVEDAFLTLTREVRP